MNTQELTKVVYHYVSDTFGTDNNASTTCAEIWSALHTRPEYNDVTQEQVTGAVKSLEARFLLRTSTAVNNKTVLSEEARGFLKQGATPATVLFRFLAEHPAGLKRSEIASLCTLSENLQTVAINALMRKHVLTVIKADKKDPDPITRIADGVNVADYNDAEYELLKKFDADAQSLSAAELKTLTLAKFIVKEQEKQLVVYRGEKFAEGVDKVIVPDLTRDMVLAFQEGKLDSNVVVKPLNLRGVLGAAPASGALHPLMQVRRSFVDIFTSLGFEQMPTERWVESSFWCFDSLFQPQQHPARDSQDTFFISGDYANANLDKLPENYLEKVREMHEHGGSGSTGWRYVFSVDETAKNIMRTHTTATSSRMLYRIAQEYRETGVFRPRKLFSIDRVFRNETPDATHLCEFHQVEGLICDYGLNLGNLMATIKQFFSKLNMGSDITFKPCFNPYTEPSMEIFGFHPVLKKDIELGNSGIFRPEMLAPMGLPEGVTVIAWGLSLERPTMIKYNIDNIRSLIGPLTSQEFVHKYPFFLPDEQI